MGRARHIRRAISIHVLRVEDDRANCALADVQLFQSTSSVWRTTGRIMTQKGGAAISIHVLRVEDDHDMYSVPSETIIISIHVLRVEDDREEFNHAIQKVDFNPRPPCGGRHHW